MGSKQLQAIWQHCNSTSKNISKQMVYQYYGYNPNPMSS